MFLPYCIVESEAEVRAPERGVGEAAVREFNEDGLRCFYSEFEKPADTRAGVGGALEFHRVVDGVFQQAQTVPFRFGHLVESESELLHFVAGRAASYRRALHDFRGKTQMEITLAFMAPQGAAASGREYMERIRSQQDALREAVAELKEIGGVESWRTKEQRERVRCYALVKRDTVPAFEKAVSLAVLPEGVRAFVSGPWPPVEFMELDRAATSR